MTSNWYEDYTSPKSTQFDNYRKEQEELKNKKTQEEQKKIQQVKDAEALKKSQIDWDAETKGLSLRGRIASDVQKVNTWAGEFGRDENGYRIWNGNIDEQGNAIPVPIAFFAGDGSSSPLGTKQYGGVDGLVPNSPQSFNEAMSEILKSYITKEGGITELKNALYEKNYLSGEYARKSLALGEQEDQYLYRALSTAMLDGTNFNINRAEKGQKSFLSFNDWLKQAPKVAAGGDGSGSGGVGGTRVVQQTFDPADYDIAIDQLFQKTVGRGASKEELDFFVQNLQNYADANPQTTVTKVSGNTTTATTTGGVTSERAASAMREQALLAPGAEEYNKATKYLSYFTEAINSPVKLG